MHYVRKLEKCRHGLPVPTAIILPLVLFGLLAVPSRSTAQESITFDQLKVLLDPFFAPELVSDVEKALPKAAFDVWGFDAGDFSGDGYNDLIVQIRMRRDRGRNMRIYFFVDVEGILEPVREETVEFIELPIDVGVTIGDGNAYVLAKRDEKGWNFWGWRYRDGVIFLHDHRETNATDAMQHEGYRNFETLESVDRYVRIRNEEEVFRSDYLTIPSYRRGRHISAGYARTATARRAANILSGAYYIEDENDLRVNVRSAWDHDFLYFNILVADDAVEPYSDKVDSVGDRVTIWLDTYILGDRITGGSKRGGFRVGSDSNIYGLSFDLGDFRRRAPKVNVSTTNLFDRSQTDAIPRIRGLASLTDSGWSLAVRIPFQLLGYSEAPIFRESLLTFGATIVVDDLDNRWRPEELSRVATSENFDPTKPATFGEVVLIPGTMHYGEARNIFLPQVQERFEEIGL